jgi:hypothetical protein
LPLELSLSELFGVESSTLFGVAYRNQTLVLPNSVDDYIGPDNSVYPDNDKKGKPLREQQTHETDQVDGARMTRCQPDLLFQGAHGLLV